MNTTRALAWNTGVQIAGKIVSTAIGVVVIGLMTRSLGQEGFGMYSTATAYFQIFGILLDLGLNVMLIQMLGERAGDKAYEDRAVSATYTLRVTMAAVVLSCAAMIGLFLPYPPVLKAALFAILGSFFFSTLNQIVIGVHQRHLKMHVVALGEIAGRLTLLFGVLFARAHSWGLVPIVGIVSLGGLVNFCTTVFIARRIAAVRWNWDPTFWKIILKRAWPIGVSILFNLIYFKADTLILSAVRPFHEVGIYGAAYRVLEILITLPFMYTGVLLPLLANAWAVQAAARFQKLYRNSLVAMLVMAAPIAAGVFVIGERVMTSVAGAEFARSGEVLKILILAAVIIFIGTVSSHAIVALDAQRKMLPIYILVALATLAGYILFIPQYGMWAAAWLTVFSEGAIALGATYVALRISRTRLSSIPYLKIALATGGMAIAVASVRTLPLFIPILVGATVYSALVLALGIVSRNTLMEIISVRRDATTTDVL